MPIPPPDESTSAGLGTSRRLLTSDVYDRLRDDIVRGRLAAGQRIYDVELAGQLGYSRATVRTALLRLMQLGLVETVPNLYTRVTHIDLKRYLQTQDTARALNVFAARYGTPALTGEHLEILSSASRLLGPPQIDPEPIFTGAASAGFFEVFLDALDNRPLDRTLQRLRPHLQRVMGQFAHLLPAAQVATSLQATVDAATRRDGEGTAEALSSYYDVALVTFHERLAEQPEFREG
jgi:DNA-binding GntR family transcriptional regulator